MEKFFFLLVTRASRPTLQNQVQNAQRLFLQNGGFVSQKDHKALDVLHQELRVEIFEIFDYEIQPGNDFFFLPRS